MITYEVRGINGTVSVKNIEEGCRLKAPDRTLWRVEKESEQEAATRRMKALEEWILLKNPYKYRMPGQTLSEFADLLSPTTRTETQLEWETGEPLTSVKWWVMHSGLYIATISTPRIDWEMIGDIIHGMAATGATEESARRNLAEIQAALKSKPKP
jgi:hypothetical protein